MNKGRKEGGKKEEGKKGGRRGRRKERKEAKKKCKCVFRLKKMIGTLPNCPPPPTHPSTNLDQGLGKK